MAAIPDLRVVFIFVTEFLFLDFFPFFVRGSISFFSQLIISFAYPLDSHKKSLQSPHLFRNHVCFCYYQMNSVSKMNNHTPFVCLFLMLTIRLDHCHKLKYFEQKLNVCIDNKWNLHKFMILNKLKNFVPYLGDVTIIMIFAHIHMWLKFTFGSEWMETIHAIMVIFMVWSNSTQ